MNIVISMNDAKYQPLADITWNQNKLLYCEKHGYGSFNKTEGFRKDMPIGFEKLFIIQELMKKPDTEWIWWTGCDAMVTNFNIKIEDRIVPGYDLIIATDCNEINNDSFLIRNCEWSKSYIEGLIQLIPKYSNHYFYEQQAMIDTYFDHKDHIKIVPQRQMNSYQNDLYPWQSKYDLLGNDGTWQEGDWLVQWPGTQLDLRLKLAKFYLNKVIK